MKVKRRKKLKQQNKYIYCYSQHTPHADCAVDEAKRKKI